MNVCYCWFLVLPSKDLFLLVTWVGTEIESKITTFICIFIQVVREPPWNSWRITGKARIPISLWCTTSWNSETSWAFIFLGMFSPWGHFKCAYDIKFYSGHRIATFLLFCNNSYSIPHFPLKLIFLSKVSFFLKILSYTRHDKYLNWVLMKGQLVHQFYVLLEGSQNKNHNICHTYTWQDPIKMFANMCAWEGKSCLEVHEIFVSLGIVNNILELTWRDYDYLNGNPGGWAGIEEQKKRRTGLSWHWKF